MWHLPLIVGILLTSNISTHILGTNHYKNRVFEIYDIVHQNTPDLYEFEYVVDALVFFIGGCFYFLPNGSKVFYEFSGKMLLLLLLRSITIFPTLFPKHKNCCCSSTLSWYQLIRGQCYDKIFSGHMSFTLLGTLYFLREGFITPFSFGLLNSFAAATIIVTRSHYTVDVILAFIITYFVFNGPYSVF